MKLLYGTGNPAKVLYMRNALARLPVELISLEDLGDAPLVAESGATPLENARIKAHAYFEAFGTPTFSCDTGLYLEGLPKELQPGVHVRQRNGKAMSDGEMTAYYGGLAERFGGMLRARYRNAICLVLDRGHVYESMGEDLASVAFGIVAKAHARSQPGFPLDRLSVHLPSGKYYYDLEGENALDGIVTVQGFERFFREAGLGA